MCVCTQKYIYTYIHIYIYTCVYVFIHTCIYNNIIYILYKDYIYNTYTQTIPASTPEGEINFNIEIISKSCQLFSLLIIKKKELCNKTLNWYKHPSVNYSNFLLCSWVMLVRMLGGRTLAVVDNVMEEESEPTPGSWKAHLRRSGREGFEFCDSITRAELSLFVCLNKR